MLDKIKKIEAMRDALIQECAGVFGVNVDDMAVHIMVHNTNQDNREVSAQLAECGFLIRFQPGCARIENGARHGRQITVFCDRKFE